MVEGNFMNLTDQELLMIEQLCYLNSDVASAAGVSDYTKMDIYYYQNKTIGEILSSFDSNAIANLQSLGNTEIDGASASGAEWAQIITHLQSNPNLNSLVFTNSMETAGGTPLALCFKDGSSGTSDAIVIICR